MFRQPSCLNHPQEMSPVQCESASFVMFIILTIVSALVLRVLDGIIIKMQIKRCPFVRQIAKGLS